MNNTLGTHLTHDAPQAPPKWLCEFTHRCVDALGLDKWDLYLIMRDRVENEEGCTLDGKADSNPTYMFANVYFPYGIEETNYGYGVVLHELMHVALAQQDNAVQRIIELVPAELQDHANELWRHGNEHDIEMVSRSLATVLREGMNGAVTEVDESAGRRDEAAAPPDEKASVPEPDLQVGVLGHGCACGGHGRCAN